MATPRAGRTIKVSVSLDKRDLATLKRHAALAHHGNLSAAFAEAARLLRQREARGQLIELLGGHSLSRAAAAAIDREQASPRRRARGKGSRRAA